METIVCIKDVKTKSGFEFKKGNHYNFTIQCHSIRIYFNEFDSIVIKNENTFNKYFKIF